eukprot:evm.model.scf_239.3 EVM.evm.TU.scf_239.3   scf_239:82804-84622(+)
MQPRPRQTHRGLLALPPLTGDRLPAQAARQIRRERGFDHDFDPLRRLICCGQLNGPGETNGGEIDLQSTLEILAFMRFWMHKMEVEAEERRAAERAAGATAPDGAMALSDDYADSLIDEALRALCDCEPSGLAGCCLGCGACRPTLMIVGPNAFCRHVVYCDDCGYKQAFRVGSRDHGPVPALPAHLWAEESQCMVTCPMCREQGRLVRIWLPEEAGGRKGLCRRCNAREARVVSMTCRHLCCCEECMEELAAGPAPGSVSQPGRQAPAIIRCPTCSTEGPAYKVFLP